MPFTENDKVGDEENKVVYPFKKKKKKARIENIKILFIVFDLEVQTGPFN